MVERFSILTDFHTIVELTSCSNRVLTDFHTIVELTSCSNRIHELTISAALKNPIENEHLLKYPQRTWKLVLVYIFSEAKLLMNCCIKEQNKTINCNQQVSTYSQVCMNYYCWKQLVAVTVSVTNLEKWTVTSLITKFVSHWKMCMKHIRVHTNIMHKHCI